MSDDGTRTGAEILWETLAREGVEVVFGYPGGAIMPAYDAMLKSSVRHVLVRHEQGAAHMADGYARASGRVGVCVATSGPGATNLVTGIATAMLDSIPMVCVTGQVASQFIGSDAFQETDITGVTLPITKHNYLVTRAEDIAPMLRQAFYVARSGRPGPVLVDITKDAQQASTPFVWDGSPVRLPGYRPEHRPSEADVRRAAELIDGAERPIVFCGHGIIAAGASHLLLELHREDGHPRGLDAARPRRLPGHASALSRDDGDARRGLGQHRHPGVRPHHRARHALRRPRDRQARDVREARQEDPLRARSRRDQQERPRRRAPHRRRGRDAAHADARHQGGATARRG